MKLISLSDYWKRFKDAQTIAKKKKGGGDGNLNAIIRNSRLFSGTVERMLYSGKISHREAGLLLNKSIMKVGT